MNLFGRRALLEIILVVFFLSAFSSSVFERLELAARDAVLNMAPRQVAVDQSIAIVDIDEASLAELGRWPWSRDVIARLINRLFDDYEIAHLGLDIIFPDSADASEHLNKALQDHNVTLASVWSDVSFPNQSDFPVAATCSECGQWITPRGWLSNQGLNVETLTTAHITPLIDVDGVVRKVPSLVCRSGECVEALGLSLARQILAGDGSYHVESSLFGADMLIEKKSGLSLPVSSRGELLLNWEHVDSPAVRISASDVLKKNVRENLLKGRVVILGSTAIGLHDQIATPVSASYPSVYLHADVYSAVLSNSLVVSAAVKSIHQYAYVVLAAALVAFLFRRYNPFLGLFGGVLLACIWLLWAVNSRAQMQELMLTPVIMTLIVFSVALFAIAYLGVEKSRRATEQRFAKYLPPEAIKELQKLPVDALQQTHVRREVTILFADLRKFSKATEQFSPEKFSRVVGIVMESFSEIIHQYGGAVDKYMGDGVMAFWGAPLPSHDHASKAVRAAQAMYAAIPDLRRKTGMKDLSISIGLNTGEVVVGEFGSKRRLSYTVMGPAVNLAAHLEKSTRQVGLPILVGSKTRIQAMNLCEDTPHQIFVASRGDAIDAFAVKVKSYENE